MMVGVGRSFIFGAIVIGLITVVVSVHQAIKTQEPSRAAPFLCAGSTAVFPFVATVAERLAFEDPNLQPIVEANGTGAGFRMFCGGSAPSPVAVVMASRPVHAEERALCSSSVPGEHSDILEVPVGYDGITLIQSFDGQELSLTMEQLFRALSKRIPVNRKLVRNPHKTWHDIDPRLPHFEIKFYGPPAHSGTRESFVHMALRRLCRAAVARGDLRDEDLAKCGRLRDDRVYVEVGNSENLILQKTRMHPMAIGIVSYCFYDNHKKKLRALSLNGQKPTVSNISQQTYPLARPLYLYARAESFQRWPATARLLEAFLAEPGASSFMSKILAKKGLVALLPHERALVRERVRSFSKKVMGHEPR